MFKVCIISCGMIANSAHIPAFKQFGEDYEIVGVCDVNENAARETAERHGIANYYTDAKEMLSKEKPDVVSVCVPNCFHKEYTIMALDSKLVGEPIKLRYINGHTGPLGKGAKHRGVSDNAEEMTDEQRGKTWWHKDELGGGVFLDIACYGCFFSRWFMGENAKSVISMGANLNTPFGNTDDNFAAAIKYDGKMSVIEGTWSTPRAVIPSGPMVLCTDGVIMCTGGAENAPDVKAFDIYGNEVEIPEIEFGDKFKNMPCQYANHISTGEDIYPMLTLEMNMEVMAILDATIKSAKSGKEEKIRD